MPRVGRGNIRDLDAAALEGIAAFEKLVTQRKKNLNAGFANNKR